MTRLAARGFPQISASLGAIETARPEFVGEVSSAVRYWYGARSRALPSAPVTGFGMRSPPSRRIDPVFAPRDRNGVGVDHQRRSGVAQLAQRIFQLVRPP